jgi:hypothetical protein
MFHDVASHALKLHRCRSDKESDDNKDDEEIIHHARQQIYHNIMSAIRTILDALYDPDPLAFAMLIRHNIAPSSGFIANSTTTTITDISPPPPPAATTAKPRLTVCDRDWCTHCYAHHPSTNDVHRDAHHRLRQKAMSIPELMDDVEAMTVPSHLKPYVTALITRGGIIDNAVWFDQPLEPELMTLITNDYIAVEHKSIMDILLTIHTPIIIEPLCDMILSYVDPPLYPLAYIIYRLWREPSIQRVWQHRSTYSYMDCTQYFLDRLPVIAACPSWPSTLPTIDVINEKVPSNEQMTRPSKSAISTSSSSSLLPPLWKPNYIDRLWTRTRQRGGGAATIITDLELPRRSSSSIALSSSSSSKSLTHRVRLVNLGSRRGRGRSRWLKQLEFTDAW